MADFTITAVSSNPPRAWGEGNLEYRVHLRNNATQEEIQNVEWSRKATSPAPVVGQVISGELDLRYGSAHGPKIKVAAGGARGGGGGGYRPKDPAERRSIAMQNSNGHGAEIVSAMIKAGLWKPASADDAAQAALKIAERFYTAVQKAEAGT